jgi:hypothetical protein
MTDPTILSLLELLAKGVSSTTLVGFLVYGIIVLYKRNVAIEDRESKNSLERENTMTIALNAATHAIEINGETMKTILITLEKQHGQSKTENKD